MECYLERIQYPVGQGGFFAEHHSYIGETSPRVIVYDCGSGTSRTVPRVLDEQITAFSKHSRGKLDALILSHFHLDHLNGVSSLLQAVKSGTRRIFIPYLSPEEQELVTLEALLPAADTPVTQGLDLATAQQGLDALSPWTLNRGRGQNDIQVVEIENSDRPAESALENSVYYGSLFVDGRHGDQVPVRLGDNKDHPMHGWILKFFCKKADLAAIAATCNNLKELGFDPRWLRHDQPRFLKWLEQSDVTKIREAYTPISGEVGAHNLVSLCCYSGPSKQVGSHDFHSMVHWPWGRCMHADKSYHIIMPVPGKIGWMGTGDLNLKNQFTLSEFLQHYADIWVMVGTIQIPHHGASRDSDAQLFNSVPMVATVHYGIGNRYGHPDELLLAAALKQGVVVCPVTNQPESGLLQPIWWSGRP
jgi:beta-lactamase superfamily II metal-dependent hydrolase